MENKSSVPPTSSNEHSHPAAKKVDGDPAAENSSPESQVTNESQKGKKVDADPSQKTDKPVDGETEQGRH